MSEATVRRYTAVSLFSGAGGFCEGARLAGFQVEAAVEIDRFAAVTYRGNFPETPLYEGDVASFLKPGRPEWEAERHRFEGVEAGGIDLVFGGPPCQGYSQIGTRDLDDPRNSLYGEFVRVLRSLQPRVFIMENVPNMLMLSRGIFRDRVLAAFRRAGYKNVAVRVIAATDFGVPQLRKRVIFFGLRDDVALPCTPGEWADKVLLNEKRPATTVGQAIGDLPQAVSHGACLPYPEAGPHNWIRDELRLAIGGPY